MEGLTRELNRLREENASQKAQIEKYEDFREESRSLYDVLTKQFEKLFAEQDDIASTFNAKLDANEVRRKLQDEEVAQLYKELEQRNVEFKILEQEATAARREAQAMRAAAEEARVAAKAALDEAIIAQGSFKTKMQNLDNAKRDLVQQVARAWKQHGELEQKFQREVQAKVDANLSKRQMLKEKEQMRQDKIRIEIECRHLKAGFETALKLWYEWSRTLGSMANERAHYLLTTLDLCLKEGSSKRWKYFQEWRGRQSLRQCADLEITDEVASRVILAYSIWQGFDRRPEWADEAEWSQLSHYLVETAPAQFIVNDGSPMQPGEKTYSGPSAAMISAFREIYELCLDEDTFIKLGYFAETEGVKVPKSWDVHKFITQDSNERMRENKLKQKVRKEKKAGIAGTEAESSAIEEKRDEYTST
ncbi:hypothetical protein SVAN01_09369 [Stagonosporopsis vannaccii]|nr:hypothetical protein SVAN01_09369 [Stagonosporopsis vannaccii]